MLRRFSIRLQLTAIISLSCMLSLTAAFGFFLWKERGVYVQREVEEMRSQTEIVGNNSSAALAFSDVNGAQETLAAFRLQHDVDHASLFTKDGNLLANYTRLGSKPLPVQRAPSTDFSRVSGDRLETAAAILVKGERVGSILVTTSLDEAKTRQNGYFMLMGLLTLGSIGASSLIGAHLQKGISDPIQNLSRTIKQVSAQENYSLRMQHDGARDEVGQLVDGFNSMLSEIQERDEALRAANERLEDRVGQRTFELQSEVAERKSKEAELVVSQKQLSDFFETAPIGIVRLDGEMRIAAANRAELEIFGFESDDFVGRPIQDFLGQCEQFSDVIASLSRGETVWNRECTIRDKRGNEKQVEINASAQMQDGNLVTAGLYMRDVTLMKKAEEIEHARERAERANQAKNEFLSRISHELRTPMNSILGFGQLLEMETLEPRAQECVGQILKGGRHLLNLINEVLNISRIDAGTISLSLEPIALDVVLHEAVDLITPMAAQRGIKVEIEQVVKAGAVVMTDRQRLSQVLINLLSNAVKYSFEGGAITCRIQANDGDSVHLLIEDTGPGISSDNVGRLFVPFDRLGAERSEVEGTGLGLPLSLSLMEAMGGTISLDLSYVGGCRFVIELPAGLEVEVAGMVRMPLSVPPFTSGPTQTILLIEDNLANVKLVEQLLASRPGYRLLVAMQGRLGFEFAREHRPDLILLDLNLPDISGFDVAQKLKCDAELAHTPLIVISADVTSAAKNRLQEIGVHGFLPKPFDVRAFLEIIDQLLCDEVKISA